MSCWCPGTGSSYLSGPPGKKPADGDTNTVMALTTTPTVVPLRVDVRRSELPALVCAVSAGTHAALVVPHLHESLPLAVGFALTTVALSVAALASLGGWSRPVSAAVAGLLLALALAYVLSRTSGIPGLVGHPESWDPVGVPLAFLEAAAAVLVVAPPHPRRHR
jgi:hypothetical protein